MWHMAVRSLFGATFSMFVIVLTLQFKEHIDADTHVGGHQLGEYQDETLSARNEETGCDHHSTSLHNPEMHQLHAQPVL